MSRKPSPELLQRVARNIKRLRRARGMTQAQLAKGSGLTKSYICNAEKARLGNPSISTLEAFAEGLGCEAWELVSVE